jgi:hypothetical protein
MCRPALPLLLVLLVLVGITDDLFASFTADPEDDALAAANNTYLSGGTAHEQRCEQGRLLPSLDCPPVGIPGSPTAGPLSPRPDELTAAPPTGANPLYRLMSLRR